MIRDPRDFFISYIRWLEMQRDRCVAEAWLSLSFDTRLLQAITYTIPPEFDNAFINIAGHVENFNKALQWQQMNLDNVLFIRFEDLVGAQGGGSEQAQLQTLHDIATFCGKSFTSNELESIATALWGDTVTFREGSDKVGAWKQLYNAQHLAAFKLHWQQLLVELNYEQDINW